MHLPWLPVWYSTLSESRQEAFLYALRVTPIKMWYNINVSRERRHGEKVKKKLTQFEKFELAEQARQARDAEWEAKEEELDAKARTGEITWDEYYAWCHSNPRPSAVIEEQMRERKRLTRKSKKNIKNNITIIDADVLREVKTQTTTIEWGDGFEEGNLVETRDGDIGMVMAQYDPTHNRVTKPKYIEAAMLGSYVRLLVNGKEEWHTKLSVSPLEDN